MSPKQLKFLQTFEQMSKADSLEEATVRKYMTSFINLDFSLALDAWDYLCTTREDTLVKNNDAAKVLGGAMLDLFYGKAAQKTVKALADAPAVRRAAYQYSPAAAQGTAFNILVDLLSANKTDSAEDILKCLVRNESISYGPALKAVLERLFIEILKKNPSKKLEMPRKLSSLLITYVSKIKTDERAMLEQRIRETM